MIKKVRPIPKKDDAKSHSCWIIWPRLFLDDEGGVYRVALQRVQHRKVINANEQTHWLYETDILHGIRTVTITHKVYFGRHADSL